MATKKLSKKVEKEVEFKIEAKKANEVFLAGDFNNWNPTSVSLKKYMGGVWRTKIKLSPGRYEYKFIVDGAWISDLKCKNQVENLYGSLNSVIEV